LPGKTRQGVQTIAKKGLNASINGVLMSYAVPDDGKHRGKAEDAVCGCELAIDLDDGRQWKDTKLAAYLPKPSEIIETSVGTGHNHNRLFLDKAYPAAELAPVMTALVACCEADRRQSIECGWRVAGSTNYPDAGKRKKGRTIAPSRLISDILDTPIYTLEEIKDALAAAGFSPEAMAAKEAAEKAKADAEFGWDARIGDKQNIDEDALLDRLNNPPKDRSGEFFHAMRVLKEAGWTPAEARDFVDGTTSAEKYSGRLDEQIMACWKDPSEAPKAATPQVDEDEYFRRGDGTKMPGERIAHTKLPVRTAHGVKDHAKNAMYILDRLPVTLWFNQYRHRVELKAKILGHLWNVFSDQSLLKLRERCFEITSFEREGEKVSGYMPSANAMFEAVLAIAHDHARNPVTEYLARVQKEWDGVPRLDAWLSAYMQAEDTELHRAFGSLTLMAAVKRAREPGCKFDQILVLESPEGKSKSTALRLLAGGPEYFSDQRIFDKDEKTQMELMAGKWIYEAGELGGLSRSDEETLKGFASRTVDRARPAYARIVEEHPRAGIIIGTTNKENYLLSQTGNRRFWPVKVGTIDLKKLEADRDQLWGEAATREATSASIFLPEHLWAVAGEAQEERRVQDPWEAELEKLTGTEKVNMGSYWEERVHTSYVTNFLGLKRSAMQGGLAVRLKTVMGKLGWGHGKHVQWFGKEGRGYVRRCEAPQPGFAQTEPIWRAFD
jgi:hypothetical protein